MGQLGSLILLPTFNERENLPLVLPRIHALEGVDVLVIDANTLPRARDSADDVLSFANLQRRASG